MKLNPDWFQSLVNSVPTDLPKAQTLISYTGAPAAGLNHDQQRVVVGLIEKSWSNPLFYPDGGFPSGLIESPNHYLPDSKDQSLLSAFSKARDLSTDARLLAYVLVANANGEIISGSRNHWKSFSSLSMDQVLGKESIHYYDETGGRHHYKQQLLPETLSSSVGINEFTLDILAARTFNQYADIAIFIVPHDSLDSSKGSDADLPDYRLAPLPADAAGRPLVISSSHGGGSSLSIASSGDGRSLWPDPPSLPAAYPAQDNTGVLFTLSAGDQVSGIDTLTTDQNQSLTFNTWPSSSPLFLTVGGVAFEYQDTETITGAVAWRDPGNSNNAMEGGNGGFSPAAAMPSYQQVSPWVQQFQSTALAASLAEGWTYDNKLFNWWAAGGQNLTIGTLPETYTFYAAEPVAGGTTTPAALAVNPTLARQMPDLSNLAMGGDFLSLTLGQDTKLSDQDWPKQILWHADGGTSLASPATAALLADVNLKRRRHGLADLSATEAHLLLYQLPPNLLTDITALQAQPLTTTTAYQAHPGYDYAAGLGAFGGTAASQLLDSLGRMSMPLMPERPFQWPDVIVKPGGLPLLLAKQQGSGNQLRLVRMNGYGANAVLQEAAQRPDALRSDLLGVLERAANASKGQANAVVYDVRTLSASWQPASADCLLNQPLERFAASEGVEVSPASLIDLGHLDDSMASADGQSSGMPAFYALIAEPLAGSQHQSLEIHPFQANQGGLLRQGAQLTSANASGGATLVGSTLQWPLLQHHVAVANGAAAAAIPPIRVELVLRSVARFANLYGVYPVDGPDGAVLDGQGERILPGDPRYAALALKAALGDGRDSFLWSAPIRGTRRIQTLQDWSNPAAPTAGTDLAQVLKPGALYQHFILSSPTVQARQELIGSLLAGNEPGAAVLKRMSFALGAANADGRSHGLGLAGDEALLNLGFEDLPGLGDRDYNDVIASWVLHDGVFRIGSTNLLDLTADRVPELAVGSQAGSPSTVVVVGTNSGATLQTWQPFGADDWSGVQVASGDVNGDGFDDLVAVRATVPEGAGADVGCTVQVLLGAAAPLPDKLNTLSFKAFGGAVAGPLSLAVRDLDLDGFAEVVLTAAKADPKRSTLALEVWTAEGGSLQLCTDLNLPATTSLPANHGYAVALGDLQGDGSVELLLGDLDGADLFMGTIGSNGATASPGVVVQPYGKSHGQGVRPTVVSAQQTLTRLPQGLSADSLPWSLGDTLGSQPALLAGLGTAGALVIQTADRLDPRPAQVAVTGWNSSSPPALLPIPWDSRDGAPVFSSGGVSYTAPPLTASKPQLLSGSPQPILVSAAAGSTRLELLMGPAADQTSGSWEAMAGSSNSVFIDQQATLAGWTNPWGANSGNASSDSTLAREQFNQVTTALMSYKPPYLVNLNPLNLTNPEQLIADLSSYGSSQIDTVMGQWTFNSAPDNQSTALGPGTPGSNNNPYPSTNLPGFTPAFTPVSSTDASPNTDNLVLQFQQRLISTAMTSLGVNYQHHHWPFWYSPESLANLPSPAPQINYLSTPEGRQTQGLDCSNFSSWNYNRAFGFWLESSVSQQALQSSATVDWLTGVDKTITAQSVLANPAAVYLTDPSDPNSQLRSKDQVIDYLNSILQPGDLIYISGNNTMSEHQSDNLPQAQHVITWLNNNSASNPLHYVDLDTNGTRPPNPAFIIDSTGSESINANSQAYPNGVQIRQFDETAWYVTNIISVSRWLTAGNVQLMADAMANLPS